MLKQILLLIRKLLCGAKIKFSNDCWLADRRKKVLESLTDPVNVLSEQPYIAGGSYEWFVEEPVHLDFYFPEKGIAIKVTGRHHGRYSDVEEHMPSRRFWEAKTKEDFFLVDVCQRARPQPIPLLLITPDDPIDPYSLSVRVRHLLKK